MQEVPYGEVGPPWWDDKPVFCLGSGPSLMGFPVERLRDIGHVAICNALVRDCPWAELLFSEDRSFVNKYRGDIDRFRGEIYLAVDCHQHAPIERAIYLRRYRDEAKKPFIGLSDRADTIVLGGNSGYGLVNVTVHKRAREIYLLGYDFSHDAATGRSHCHDHYKGRPVQYNQRYLGAWAQMFDHMVEPLKKRGIKVFNCNSKSKVTAFPIFEYARLERMIR